MLTGIELDVQAIYNDLAYTRTIHVENKLTNIANTGNASNDTLVKPSIMTHI